MDEAGSSPRESGTTRLLCGDEEVKVPQELLEDRDIFSHVLSRETWEELLTEEERARLTPLLPQHPELPAEDIVRQLFSGENFRFGNPIDKAWEKLSSGELCPEVSVARQQLRALKFQQYEQSQKHYYLYLFQELLINRQELLQTALREASLDGFPTRLINGSKRKQQCEKCTETKYRRILQECRREVEQGGTSSDEDKQKEPEGSLPISEEYYRRMLRKHRQRRRMKKTDPDLITSGLNLAKVTQRPEESKKTAVKPEAGPQHHHKSSKHAKKAATSSFPGGKFPSGKFPAVDEPEDFGGGGRGADYACIPRPSARAKAVYEAYAPIDTGTRREPIPVTIVLPALPSGHYMSFFSLLKHVFEPLHDKKGELAKLSRSVRSALRLPDVAACSWVQRRDDWLDLVLSAMSYLAAELGAVSSFDPLPHYIPILEFRDRIDHWKWIGQGRDSDVELLVLCNHWLETLDQALPIVDFSDYEPPPPHVWTHYVFRQSTPEEIKKFRAMEKLRYASPHKSYLYNIHGFEAPVGPVKGVKATKKESSSSKARGHALLLPNRPTCVTILSLVRDACSRLPRGEGTRLDLCVMVKDSGFLQDTVTDSQLNNAVSGALDRLHYEKDPCVRYDSTRKLWMYLHRGRTEEDFELIFWASEVASKQRKMLMARQKLKPKIVIRNGKQEITASENIPSSLSEALTETRKPAGQSDGLGGGTMLPQAAPKATSLAVTSSGASVVVASVVQAGRIEAVSVGVGVASSTGQQSVGVGPQNVSRQSGTIPAPPSAVHAKEPRHGGSTAVRSRSKKTRPRSSRLPAAMFPTSDWESSDEELPFLHSSLPRPPGSSKGSTSSWQSSDSEGGGAPPSSISATPTFLANLSVGAALGERLSGSEGEGGKFQTVPPWLSANSSDSD